MSNDTEFTWKDGLAIALVIGTVYAVSLGIFAIWPQAAAAVIAGSAEL